MHERRIADDGDGVRRILFSGGFIESVQAGNGRAHADGRVDGGKRRGGAQRIAADVAEDRQLVLFQRIKQTSVRTARAHDRRTARDCFIQLLAGMDRHTELFRHIILAELADAAEQLLAGDVLYADGAAMRFNNSVQLFDNDDLFNAFREFLNFFYRQGIDHAELQNRVAVTADLLDVLIAGRRRDEADGMVGSVLHAVDLCRLSPCLQG